MFEKPFSHFGGDWPWTPILTSIRVHGLALEFHILHLKPASKFWMDSWKFGMILKKVKNKQKPLKKVYLELESINHIAKQPCQKLTFTQRNLLKSIQRHILDFLFL